MLAQGTSAVGTIGSNLEINFSAITRHGKNGNLPYKKIKILPIIKTKRCMFDVSRDLSVKGFKVDERLYEWYKCQNRLHVHNNPVVCVLFPGKYHMMTRSSYFNALLAVVVCFTIVVAAEPDVPEAEAEYYHRPYPRYEEHDYPPYHGKPTVVAGACATKYDYVEVETIANATSEYFYAQSSCLIGIANGTIPEGYTYKVGGSCSIECDDYSDYDDFLSSYTDLIVGDETQIGGSLFCGATATPDYTPNSCKILAEVYCCKPIASHGYMSREEARMKAEAEREIFKQQVELKALKKAAKRVKPDN